MNEVVRFLQANPVQYLATADQGNHPRVRPFQFMLEKGGRLYFCTSRQKDVYAEMQNNQNVELCVSSPGFAWLRLNGRAVFSDDAAIKAAILEQNPMVRSIYKTPDNPYFTVFYLQDAHAVIADFSGQPPQQIVI